MLLSCCLLWRPETASGRVFMSSEHARYLEQLRNAILYFKSAPLGAALIINC